MAVYQNISSFKAYRTNLLQSLYQHEGTISIGQVRFNNPPYTGLVLKLWKDAIYIEYHKSYDEVLKSTTREKLESIQNNLDSMITCAFWEKGVVITPANKDEFPDTKMGMKLRAEYYVLIADKCLTCFNDQHTA